MKIRIATDDFFAVPEFICAIHIFSLLVLIPALEVYENLILALFHVIFCLSFIL